MKKSILNKQSGFSLVELMVVVAIIGILAALSVGQVQKQIAKSRQAEAKTNLASVYTSEKSFNAEFAAYTDDFGALGLGFDGNMRYDVGFSAAATLPPPAGYTGSAASTIGSAAAFCTGQCVIVPSNGLAPPAVAGAITATTFAPQARAYIFNATDIDTWEINQDKIYSQPENGIP